MSTIVAIATARGAGGIGDIRLSGPDAKKLLKKVFRPHARGFQDFQPWRLHHGRLLDDSGEGLDDVLAVFMPGPATFTGEDVAEIHCHGGTMIVEEALGSLLRLGARMAERGEFSRRAFLNGRMDLSQAEAVCELIGAPSRQALRYSLSRLDGILGRQVELLQEEVNELRALARLGLDFPEDEVEILSLRQFLGKAGKVKSSIASLLKNARRGRIAQHGVSMVLAGLVNAGKSSLFNAIAGKQRALVTDLAGTTRDFLEIDLNFDGLPVRLVDTAGLREETDGLDPVEKLGITKTGELARQADLILLVIDGSAPRQGEDALRALCRSVGSLPILMVWNKCDIAKPCSFPPDWAAGAHSCVVSAQTGENLEELIQLARKLVLADPENALEENGLAPNVRQSRALEIALDELNALEADLISGLPYDCALTRLDTAAEALGEIIRVDGTSELLDRIFSNFCIGK